jgi:asparagine synthetase A
LIDNLQAKHSDQELINNTRQDQGHWVEIMCDKRKNYQFIKIVPAHYKQYQQIENCYELLEKGIDAVMVSYDRTKFIPVTLSLNKKHTQLDCKEKKQTFINKYFKFPTKIIFSSNTGIMYGGVSSTF